ncbi:hypothetical protein ACNFIC_09450 [Pseudomonas sp. NY15463]|uniref:hypothetical protein n=1 Tax=Pseudomonas sp. NY15463 TaxID=3400361 RepID=UPI003A874F70
MSLEIATGTSMQEIGSVLSGVGAEVCIDNDDLSGNLGASNTYFVFRKCHELEQVVTEGVSVSWAVGVRGAFHCPVDSLAQGSSDIKRFLTDLSEKNQCYFIFSFQYESVYAVRDEDGLRFLNEMVG